MVTGCCLGGFGSHPSELYPNIFGNTSLFKHRPYLLPSALAALVPIGGLYLAKLHLDESLPPDQRSKRPFPPCRRAPDAVLSLSPQLTDTNTVLTQRVTAAIVSGSLFTLCADSSFALIPLFAFSPVNSGGLGFAEWQIAFMLVVRGVASGAIHLLFFPSLQRRFGNATVVRVCAFAQTALFVLLPSLNRVARIGCPSRLMWMFVGCVMIIQGACLMGLAASSILVINAAPARGQLGVVSGISQCWCAP